MASAANIETVGNKGGGKEGVGGARPNPVALGVVVSVTGARPSGSSGSRDLFSEETITVLVFRDGAVIELMAAVSVGQLLFLTNKKSNQEVVCQVVHKRSFKPTVCYVELQFTEEQADFWGVAFPEGKDEGSESKVAEQVQAEETTEDDTGAPVVPLSKENVDQLRKEVEALGKKTVAESAAVPKPCEVQNQPVGQPAEASELRVSKAKLELAPVNDPSPEAGKTVEEAPLMPEAADKKESGRAVVGMKLPNRKTESRTAAEEEKGPAEELLPEPALDFSRVAERAVHPAKNDADSIHERKGAALEKIRVAGLSALLMATLAGGAWYGKWWRYMPLGKKVAGAAAGSAAKVSGARGATGNGNVGIAARNAPMANASESKGAVAEAGEAGKEETAAGSASGEEAVAGTKRANSATGALENNATTVKDKSAGRAALKRKGHASQTAEGGAATAAVPNDAPVIPAKLLRAADPVYPPEAMRNYITGDVKAEVVVAPTGHVGEVRVISGPAALRAAAMEALKQYEYAPATQGGKAIASKATATVKFWFNP